MKTRIIAFPFDDEKVMNAKIKLLKTMVGEDNVSIGNLVDVTIPEINVRCNKKQWNSIKLKLDLQKTYY